MIAPIYLYDLSTPVDVALDKAFAALKLERLGGASGRGWSRYRSFQICPKQYYYKHVDPERNDGPKADRKPLAIGSLWHAMLAVHYFAQMHGNAGPTWRDLAAHLQILGINREYLTTSTLLAEHYFAVYKGPRDYLKTLAVEYLARDEANGRSCRLDRVVGLSHEKSVELLGVPGGTWILESKTTSRLDASVTQGWHMDGEILGQVAIWLMGNGLARFEAEFGPLRGVVIDLITKERTPRVHREWVLLPEAHARRQWRDLDWTDAMIRTCEATDRWPRQLANCWHRFGPCDFLDRCRNTTEL